MKHELTEQEKSFIQEVDNAIVQLQLQRLGALQMCIRTRSLIGNYTYENGYLISADGDKPNV